MILKKDYLGRVRRRAFAFGVLIMGIIIVSVQNQNCPQIPLQNVLKPHQCLQRGNILHAAMVPLENARPWRIAPTPPIVHISLPGEAAELGNFRQIRNVIGGPIAVFAQKPGDVTAHTGAAGE